MAEDRAGRDRELFDRVAASYCRKDVLPASRLARRLRLERSLSLLPRASSASGHSLGKLLDAGCGAGFTARYLEGRYASYLGVDHSAALVATAREHNGGPGRHFLAGDLMALPEDQHFDTIVMIGVLHHVDPMAPILAKLVRLLTPGGWLVANEPQPANPLVGLARRVRKRLDPAYSDEQVELSARQLEQAYGRAGLTEIQVRGQGFLSTPFAEVPLPLQGLALPFSHLACAGDQLLERSFGSLGVYLSWNVIAAGRRAA